jgi:hypothetical protein
VLGRNGTNGMHPVAYSDTELKAAVAPFVDEELYEPFTHESVQKEGAYIHCL